MAEAAEQVGVGDKPEVVDQPEISDLVRDLQAAVVGNIYRCEDCSHAYLVTAFFLDNIECLSEQRWHIDFYDLTKGVIKYTSDLTYKCLEEALVRIGPRSLSPAEAENLAAYEMRQEKT